MALRPINENESLKTSLLEARQRAESFSAAEASNQVQPCEDFTSAESTELGEFGINTSQIAPFSFAPPSGLLNAQHEMSAKKLDFLEQEAMRCVQLEEQVRQLEKSLQILTTQYNELLEVDGERLERIEELEHDVIDLRQLIKDQVSVLPDPITLATFCREHVSHKFYVIAA
ncbi:hypothetical protein OESDEN_00342 [Oesophagostomum dentatum]|uniref:TATA element modulatory factor 1 TATA binding domain-containing protein n=1 Tax=Oesophagostomum dentatum TaxID=61180 RepID=A0A0B1TW63_OESDE|nr:hypothetical protein OESDEN_00342 [Oesophagostomum dentatum]